MSARKTDGHDFKKRHSPKKPKRLNRYTSLPVLLDMLQNRRITLLPPDNWEDQNDAYFLERYREVRGYTSVLAICFSTCYQTFHHWRIFAHGPAGICIEFDPDLLLSSFAVGNEYKHGNAIYTSIEEAKSAILKRDDWPFLKRTAFEPEGEYRIIYRTKRATFQYRHVTINLAAIRKITLSPWLPKPITDSVIATIKDAANGYDLDIKRSLLLNSFDWRAIVDSKKVKSI